MGTRTPETFSKNIDQMKTTVKKRGFFSLPFLWRMLLKEGSLVGVIVFSTVSTLLAMAVPVMTGRFIDSIGDVDVAIIALFALLITAAASLCAELSGRWYASMKFRRLKLCLQKALAEEFAAINPGRMGEFTSGEMVAKLLRDAEAVASLVQDIAPMAAMTVVGIACSFYITFMRSISIGAMMVLLAMACVLLLMRFSHRIARANRSNRTAMDRCMSILVEMVDNLPWLKAMSAVCLALSRMGGAFERANSAGWNLDKENLWFESSVKGIMFLGEATVLSVAGLMAVKGRVSVGDVVMFQMLFAQTLGSISTFFRLMPSMGYVNEAVSSIGELIDFDGKEHDEHKRKFDTLNGRVELRNVSFAYTLGERPVLNGMSFALKGNECCALVGANGSGKTTLAKLVGAFFEPNYGEVLFDGVDWREIDRESLRRKISFLFQEPKVFTGTLRENVALGEDFSDKELSEVLTVCGLSQFVKSHTEGLDYHISSNGLSGGERQRIAAARALIRKPSILILDEPGNHIDASGFGDLKKIIESANGQSAILLITHDSRLSAIADRVVSIKKERNQNEGS